MIHEIILPMLGETMDEGQITAWRKAEGDKVTKGEPLFEVTTDKAAFEAESPADGFLRKIGNADLNNGYANGKNDTNRKKPAVRGEKGNEPPHETKIKRLAGDFIFVRVMVHSLPICLSICCRCQMRW